MEEQVEKIEGLTVGRMVHYVLTESDATPRNAGEHRPAVIVVVWDEVFGTSNLQVFMDSDGPGANDGEPNLQWITSIQYSEEKEPGTWHFIEAA